MADNFIAEANNTAGEIFATDQDATSSAHYPIGKITWGALNTFNLTSTSAPFPIQLFGNGLSSAAPLFVSNNSAHLVYVRDENSTTVTIAALSTASKIQTELVGNASVVTSSGAALHVRGLTDSHVAVTGDSGAALFVRGLTDSHVAITSDSGNPVFVRGLTSSGVNVINDTATMLVVRGATDSTLPISGSSATTIGMSLNAIAGNSGGALQSFATVLSSAIESATTSAARLYGYYMFNPDTAATLYVKVFDDDSAGVTKGTTAATINIALPPQGGANVSFPQGILMSSGISVLAAGGTGLTDTSAPSTSAVVNLFFAG